MVSTCPKSRTQSARPLALQRYLDACEDKVFNWGTFDCCLFVADWLNVVNGVDVAADFRGRYKTAIGAKRRLTRLGFSDIQSVFKHHLKPIEIAYAQRGDIALVEFEGELVGGIVCMNIVYCVTNIGLSVLEMSAVSSCYSQVLPDLGGAHG
ncbi:DUF6950 family protein [Pseudoalteromonas luteoviolacea]|uniref:DUF6950 domain-containing protein n=1 Tax=Pseudoalteromonas luteoviolacea DSM 6061 TaxID=1365250 RepID=A0A161ZZF7_9GAMM|nr:hypothetical protein [Pseudoalteromonas luteoviolacea]KZN39851.1 hypothetical protein N475_13925 [Pseudoalteromonas luteoviolacea DSM 6061]MBE0385791.1 hypothetical protein [Pseudoalteromonas luteoviolacea DSM 6061]